MSETSTARPAPSAAAQFQTLLITQLRQLLRARKTIALFIVQLIPAVAAFVYVIFQDTDGLTMFRNIIESVTFPFLVPLAALFYGGPTIVDEMEGRTLTYLTLRPIPRPVLYLGKLAAGWIMGAAVVVLPMIALFFVSLVTSNDLAATVGSLGQLSAAAAIGVVCYSSIFALLGAMFSSSLISGIVYFVAFEIVFAALPVLELLSVRYYLRTIAEFNAGDRLGVLEQFILDKPIVFPVWAGLLVTGLLIAASAGAGAYVFQEKQYNV